MRKTLTAAVLLIALLCLPSCSARSSSSTPASLVTPLSSELIGSASGRVKFVRPEGSYVTTLAPFNTTITGNVYSYSGTYTESELAQFETDFAFRFSYLHALADRHYDYTVDDKAIANLKTINDSYGTGKAVTVDPLLYSMLKKSYQFSLDSGGKFNIFLGNLSQLYEDKIAESEEKEKMTALNYAWSLSADVLFSSDIPAADLEKVTVCTPHDASEMKDLLTFDDATDSVTFHAFSKTGCESSRLSLSLGGCAKGMATESVADQFLAAYPNLSLLINSGTSSVKAIGVRPDQKAWNIKYANPVYYEKLDAVDTLNSSEVYVKHSGAFNLSTSSYYEQYFYVADPASGKFLRRHHIVDSASGVSEAFFDEVSVFLDDAGLADMYTTALMNTASLSEAKALYLSLNTIYGEKDPGLLLCFKSPKGDSSSSYAYDPSQMKDLSSSGLPEVKLSDGTVYSGDYSDITRDQIQSAVSSFVPSFQVTYLASDSVFSSLGLISDTQVAPNQDKILAVLGKLS